MARVRGSASNKSGDSHPWRRRCCSESTRSCCKCVESVERGDPPCEESIPASSPLRCVNTRHVTREMQNDPARSLRLQKLALVIVHRQLVTLRLHSSGFTLFVSCCLARITSRDGLQSLRNANGLQQRTNSRGLLFRGSRWRGPTTANRPIPGLGLKTR